MLMGSFGLSDAAASAAAKLPQKVDALLTEWDNGDEPASRRAARPMLEGHTQPKHQRVQRLQPEAARVECRRASRPRRRDGRAGRGVRTDALDGRADAWAALHGPRGPRGRHADFRQGLPREHARAARARRSLSTRPPLSSCIHLTRTHSSSWRAASTPSRSSSVSRVARRARRRSQRRRRHTARRLTLSRSSARWSTAGCRRSEAGRCRDTESDRTGHSGSDQKCACGVTSAAQAAERYYLRCNCDARRGPAL